MSSTEYEKWLASRPPDPPEWALIVENPRFLRCPETITTAEDAFTALGHYLWCWKKVLRFSQGGELFGEHQQEANPEADRLDQKLAAFAEANPGTLDGHLADLEHQQVLAQAQTREDAQKRRDRKILGGAPESLLSVFLTEARIQRGEPLWRTLQQLDPVQLLGCSLKMQLRFESSLDSHLMGVAWGLLGSLLRQSGASLALKARQGLKGTLPLGLLDGIDAVVADEASTFRFPNLLPHEAELVQLSPDEIRAALAHYRGVPPEAFDALLVRRHFLAEGEHVGEVIRRDAQTLLTLGITRFQLADALQKASEQKKALFPLRKPLKVQVVRWAGHHPDPFHLDDTHYLSHEVGGSADVMVRNTKRAESIAYGTMLPYLIRRACFFEGAVPYRLDPAAACRVVAPLLRGAFVHDVYIGDV